MARTTRLERPDAVCKAHNDAYETWLAEHERMFGDRGFGDHLSPELSFWKAFDYHLQELWLTEFYPKYYAYLDSLVAEGDDDDEDD